MRPTTLSAALVALLAAFAAAAPADAQSLNNCTSSSGMLRYPTGGACWSQPDLYRLMVYEAGLCTSAPIPPTGSSSGRFTSCVTVFSNSSGSTVDVQLSSSSALSGSYTRPPNGTYTHGYVRIANQFQVSASVDFGPSAAIVSQTTGTGRYCATTSGSTAARNTSVCDSTPPTAGTLSVTTDDFDGSAGFSASDSVTFSGSSGNPVTMDGYLLDSGGTLASSAGAVTGLLGIQTFGSALTVTSATTGMDIGFRVTSGMTVIDAFGALQFDAGPFIADITLR